MSGIRRRGCLKRSHGARFGDPFLQNLTVLRLAIAQHKIRVDRLVPLAERRVDADLFEERIEAEGAGLVGDDWHDSLAQLRVPDEVAEEPPEGHRRTDRHLRAQGELGIDFGTRRRERPGPYHAARHEPTQGPAAFQHVLDFVRVRSGVVVGRVLDLRIGDRQLQAVAEDAQLGLGELLGLVGDVARFHARAQRPALGRLGQNHRGGADVLSCGPISGVDLAVVVPASPQPGQLVVGQVLREVAQLLVRPEEVLSDVGPARDGELLEVAVEQLVHLVDEQAVDIAGQQVVPLASPNDLDHVPAGTAEETFELLDDLAVAADRPVETLQVAVDDEGEVVEALARGQRDACQRLGLVHLAVAEEGPDAACRSLGQASIGEVAIEARLVHGGQRAETHRYRWELPEVGHSAGVGIARQPDAARQSLLAEVVQIRLAKPALEECPGVDAGGGMALEEDLISRGTVVLAAEEVVEADLVQRRCTGVRGQVPTDSGELAVGPHDHRHGVPADQPPDAALHLLVARKEGFLFGADGVDVAGLCQRGQTDVQLAGSLQQLVQDESGPLVALLGVDLIERVEPLLSLGRIRVRQLMFELIEVHVRLRLQTPVAGMRRVRVIPKPQGSRLRCRCDSGRSPDRPRERSRPSASAGGHICRDKGRRTGANYCGGPFPPDSRGNWLRQVWEVRGHWALSLWYSWPTMSRASPSSFPWP